MTGRPRFFLNITIKDLIMPVRPLAPIKAVAIVFGVTAISVTGYFLYDRYGPAEISELPEVVAIPAGDYNVRLIGDFRIGTRIVDAPMRGHSLKSDLQIMKYHVSQTDYMACVSDGGCQKTVKMKGEDMPQVTVNYLDAVIYAKWFSEKTKRSWRLPSAAEW